MNKEKLEKFYKYDKKEYIILKNKKLLKWLKDSIKNGYNVYFNIEDLQSLIDKISIWYEIKYSERQLKLDEEIIDIKDNMNIENLYYRLSDNQLQLMMCDYKSSNSSFDYDTENKNILNKLNFIKIGIKNKTCLSDTYYKYNPYFFIVIDSNTGNIINNSKLKNYLDKDNININDLYKILRDNYSNELDIKELESCIFNHNCDIELRNKILELSELKLLYSKNTTLNIGYERAKKLINEFNSKFNLNLCQDIIDERISKDYTNDIETENYMQLTFDFYKTRKKRKNNK